jgi:hypothetical protein
VALSGGHLDPWKEGDLLLTFLPPHAGCSSEPRNPALNRVGESPHLSAGGEGQLGQLATRAEPWGNLEQEGLSSGVGEAGSHRMAEGGLQKEASQGAKPQGSWGASHRDF